MTNSKNQTKHLSTDNYTIVRKNYFDTIVVPALSSLQKKTEPIIKNYIIAGKKVHLVFYSPILSEKMSHALEHHSGFSGDQGDLTVHLWDSITTETKMMSPWSKPEYSDRQTNAQNTIGDAHFLGVYLFGEETLNLYNKENKVAYFWTRDANVLPDWISAAPLRTLLHWFLSDYNIHLVHGGVVASGGNAILLGAKGGSGKSTTALSSLLSGMDYLADDYVAIEIGEKNIAYSLYNSVKITPNTLNVFPELSEKIWNKETVGGELDLGKAIVFMSKFFPKQMVEKSELVAICIPTIKNETKIVPASKLATMLALAPTILFQLPLASSSKMSDLKEIIATTPCYFLELGPEIRKVPEVLQDFLKHAK